MLKRGFVIVDSFFYSPGSLLQCIDLCFKSFFAFNLEYPSESEYIWLSIQQVLYGINIPHQHIPASVLEFIMNLRLPLQKSINKQR